MKFRNLKLHFCVFNTGILYLIMEIRECEYLSKTLHVLSQKTNFFSLKSPEERPCILRRKSERLINPQKSQGASYDDPSTRRIQQAFRSVANNFTNQTFTYVSFRPKTHQTLTQAST
jgi:hypothetical protein